MGQQHTKEEFCEALATFVAGAQCILNEHHKQANYTNLVDILSIKRGLKFAKIVRTRQDSPGSASVHCFVDMTNGDVLKAAGWQAPAKHARGNIFDANNGLAKMGPYGPAYLR